MTEECGDYGGTTNAGNPCERDAGWGTDTDTGPCRDHEHEYGIPDKLDEATVQTLVGAAQRGALKKHCAQVAEITPQTLRNWLNEGESHAEDGIDSKQADLFLRFQRARAGGALQRLEEVSPEFVLERSYGYTKTERHEVDMQADVTNREAEPIDEAEAEVILEAYRDRRRG